MTAPLAAAQAAASLGLGGSREDAQAAVEGRGAPSQAHLGLDIGGQYGEEYVGGFSRPGKAGPWWATDDAERMVGAAVAVQVWAHAAAG